VTDETIDETLDETKPIELESVEHPPQPQQPTPEEPISQADIPPETRDMMPGAHFPNIPNVYLATGITVFEDGAYYKQVMAGGSDEAKRLHAVYTNYAKAADPKDRALYRQQIVSAYWNYLATIAPAAANALNDPKKYLLRFAMLNPAALTGESRALFARVNPDDPFSHVICYLDEWFKMVGKGDIAASSTDEKYTRNADSTHYKELLERANGKLNGTTGLINTTNEQRRDVEAHFRQITALVMQHQPCLNGPAGIDACYSDAQKRDLTDMAEVVRQMLKLDRQMVTLLENYNDNKEDIRSIQARLSQVSKAESVSVNLQAINTEFESVRQMAKMTIGRQGNAFPFLCAEYFRVPPPELGCRENVIKMLDWTERIDKDLFVRHYRNHVNRVVPFVLLLPTYGDYGICWEPVPRTNRVTGRGRIAIPMYPKHLKTAVLTALGDFRWQAAKEEASFYWMEEGLTGNYYQWFLSEKLKGDVKSYFIRDYIAWITKESEGIQTLNKEIRGAFWRYMPFAQDVKERLKTRNLVYQELYQRDKNREMSDGY
jgi:hypothetical protein